MDEPEPMVQVAQKDMDELMELLGGYKTMLLSHERRLGVIETLLSNTIAAAPKQPQDHRRKST